MKDYIKTLKEWYNLAKPNKVIWFCLFILVVLTQVCLIVAPIFAAKVTIAMTNSEFLMAVIYLLVVFSLLFLRKSLWHINYLLYSKMIKSSYNKLSNEFVNKSLNAKSVNFKTITKEHILNIVHTDIKTVADFADQLATASARLVMTFVSIIVIFTVNVYAGIIVIVADILDFFVLNWASSKRQKYVRAIRENNDKLYEKFSEIVDTRETIKDLGVEKQVKKEYNSILDDYISNLHKRTFWESIKESYYVVFYEFLILLATLISVFLVSQNMLKLETYFVIVSYVTNGITNTKDLYGVIPYFKETSVATARVKTVLNFVEHDNVEFGKVNLTDVLGGICFDKVSYKKDDEGNPTIKDFDALLKEKETSLILGPRNCGKRTIFNLLRRVIKQNEGQILISGVDLFDYNEKSYRSCLSYVTTHPTFFNGSIIKNLSVVEKNKKIIYQVCKELNLYDFINALPQKFSSDISILPYDKLYLLGLARAILTSSDILVLYEFPDGLSAEEQENVKSILHKMHGTRTIIIFSAKDICQDISDKIITMERGTIKSISYNETKKDII
ncbi:MAG: ABC transporter transmembrane domain-containing protein [Candidatus Caccovivens sp.]